MTLMARIVAAMTLLVLAFELMPPGPSWRQVSATVLVILAREVMREDP